MTKEKIIIYQALPRLFGNTKGRRVSNGTLEQNGCGKLNDFTSKALQAIKELGANYIWYTGVIEHATQTDFSKFNIPADHPAVVKGNAGSPYAIKDYYDIAPSLATNIPQRMQEFENLVSRSHQNDLKVLIDFVPNHVARQYHSDSQPKDTVALGERDNITRSFSPYNNFYYLPQSTFKPRFSLEAKGFPPYHEYPAKVTGNNQFTPSPTQNDWYETVKLNYGVDYLNAAVKRFDPIPDTWLKMRDILVFWTQKGVDGFRCDMIEMVPVEFWEWVIPHVKEVNPSLIFIGEAYNHSQYEIYLERGKFDYLYDKIGLYDTLKGVIQEQIPASTITSSWQSLGHLQTRMLNFLENHDEQRIASPFFANDSIKALPALVVSVCMNTCPFLIYSGQEFGEKGMDQEGFSGEDGRTSIFDYWNIDTLTRWNNGGKFNLDHMTSKEVAVYNYYKRILNIAQKEAAISKGLFFDLMYVNSHSDHFNPARQYAFLRKYKKEVIFICVNFANTKVTVDIKIPQHAFDYFEMKPSNRVVTKNLITNTKEVLTFTPQRPIRTELPPYGSKIMKLTIK